MYFCRITFVLLLFVFTNIISQTTNTYRDPFISKIKIYNGQIMENEFESYLYDKYINNADDLKIYLEGKICDAASLFKFKTCLLYEGVYNHKWVRIFNNNRYLLYMIWKL